MKEKVLRNRSLILAAAVTLLLLVYLLRLMQLQVVQGESLSRKINENQYSYQTIKATRGEIFDRNGRPLVTNTTGLDVIIDMAHVVPSEINGMLLRLTKVMEAASEDWIDDLPLTNKAPFQFQSGESRQQAITAMKSALGVGAFATAEDCVYHLRKKYKLEDWSDSDFRKVAGIRYEMDRRGFDMSTPYTFAANIKIETVPKIKERSFELPGIDVVETPQRQYVSGTMGAHMIGTTGILYKEDWDAADEKIKQDDATYTALINGREYKMTDIIGRSGAEKAFETYLKGTDGRRQIVQDAQGRVIETINEQEQIPGKSIMLTIDSRIQTVAQDALERKIISMQNDLVHYPPGEGHEADAGAVVAIHVKTGEVLAAANYPTYDLSSYQKNYNELLQAPKEPLFDRALNGQYTPGSIFKPVVALGGLNENILTRNDTVNCQKVYDVLGWPRYCLDYHGPQNVLQALAHSCNIYFYDVGRKLGIDRIYDYATQLGLGTDIGAELPYYQGRVSNRELKMRLRNEPWQEGDTVQAAIGQLDTQFSPLALAAYCAALANEGTRYRTTFLKSVRSYTFDETVYEHAPEITAQIDAPYAFQAIHDGMFEAAQGVTGTARGTFGRGLYDVNVCAKTGTPETSEHPNSTFIAYAPAEDPEIAVCVVIERGWHGYTGAPVAKEVFEAYFGANSAAADTIPQYAQLIQ